MTVLSLTDAKTHLNITANTYDDELSDFIEACESLIAHKCGPLESTSVTERVRGCGLELIVSATPVISLTSVTPVGGGSALTGLHVSPKSGVVTLNSGLGFIARNYDVVYLSGRAEVPADLLMGIKELVRIAWSGSQRGSTKRPGSSPSDGYSNTLPGVGDELPFDVQKWISDYVQGPGVG